MANGKNHVKLATQDQSRGLEIRWSERRLYQAAKVGACTAAIRGAAAMSHLVEQQQFNIH